MEVSENCLVVNYFRKKNSILDCDVVVLEAYLDHKFQDHKFHWPQEGLNCEYLAHEVVT